MPLPKPRKNEKKQEFISRCIRVEALNEKNINKRKKKMKQYAAICYRIWDTSKKSAESDMSILSDALSTEAKRVTFDEYIDDITQEYKNSQEGGHGIYHITQVRELSLHYADLVEKEMKIEINYDMVKAAATFHDYSLIEDPDRDNHHTKSAQAFLRDKYMDKYFSGDQKVIIACAIEDHRKSLQITPRSIYGCILSEADRGPRDIRTLVLRCYKYRTCEYQKLKNIKTEDELYEDIRQHLLENYCDLKQPGMQAKINLKSLRRELGKKARTNKEFFSNKKKCIPAMKKIVAQAIKDGSLKDYD